MTVIAPWRNESNRHDRVVQVSASYVARSVLARDGDVRRRSRSRQRRSITMRR